MKVDASVHDGYFEPHPMENDPGIFDISMQLGLELPKQFDEVRIKLRKAVATHKYKDSTTWKDALNAMEAQFLELGTTHESAPKLTEWHKLELQERNQSLQANTSKMKEVVASVNRAATAPTTGSTKHTRRRSGCAHSHIWPYIPGGR